MRPLVRVLLLVLPAMLYACGDDVIDVSLDKSVVLVLEGLRPLDPLTEGSYEGWFIGDAGDIRSAGRFVIQTDPATVTLEGLPADVADLMITVEPPSDNDDKPSDHKLLGGKFQGSEIALHVTGYLTVVGIPLELSPGVHVLATPSDDDAMGFPSREDAGLWLFNPLVDTLHSGYYADFAPLTEGWSYEGWVVHDYGLEVATWVSYGKFKPDPFRQANVRDDTGLGVFSGRRDYEFALGLTLHVPGDDWLSDSLGIDATTVDLPIDLNGDSAQGVESRWTHVITVEPWGPNREAELPSVAQPFFLEPYRNPIGNADPSSPRTIQYDTASIPSGTGTRVN